MAVVRGRVRDVSGLSEKIESLINEDERLELKRVELAEKIRGNVSDDFDSFEELENVIKRIIDEGGMLDQLKESILQKLTFVKIIETIIIENDRMPLTYPMSTNVPENFGEVKIRFADVKIEVPAYRDNGNEMLLILETDYPNQFDGLMGKVEYETLQINKLPN